MASKVLISTAPLVAPKRAASSSPLSVGFNPLSVGFAPSSVSFSSSSSSSLSKRAYSGPSLVARAQQQDFSSVGPNPGPVHAPWTLTEDDLEVKMRFDMPGLAPEDIDVKVEGNMLVVKDLGRQLFSPYDAKVPLPPYCAKHDIKAILKNGVLHITVPKIPKFEPNTIHVPVRLSPIM